MLSIVIPMAGAGSRFAKAGYKDPKPLIPVSGVPMIQLVISNLRPKQAHRFIFIAQAAHVEAYGLDVRLKEWAPGCVIIGIDKLTEGAACTALKAREHIENDDPLMIANSDQYVDTSIDAYLREIEAHHLDGLIMTMTANDKKWSFVGLDGQRQVSRVVEKEVISNEATVGIYNFARGSDFVRAADAMMAADERVNGEFYVAPAYNRLIAEGARIGIHNIGAEARGMYGLGIPADLDLFLSLPVCARALEGAGSAGKLAA
jgi:dTDP-glucose pyrophosphorylase